MNNQNAFFHNLWRCALAASLALLVACQTPSKREAEVAAQASHDGLVEVDSAVMDQLFMKPGTTLGGYDQVMVELADIAFRADWKPERHSPLYQMTPPDRERIREDMRKNFNEAVRKALEGGGYEVVEQAGRDVLGVRASITDLYINAPDTFEHPGRVTQYTRDTASMTLVAELYDSVTGEVIARAVDRDHGLDQGWFQRTNALWTNAEARRTFTRWAMTLREALDEARESSAPQ